MYAYSEDYLKFIKLDYLYSRLPRRSYYLIAGSLFLRLARTTPSCVQKGLAMISFGTYFLIHHQHIHTPLQNIKSDLGHQVFFVEGGVYFCYFKAADLSVLHELADKVFRFSFL